TEQVRALEVEAPSKDLRAVVVVQVKDGPVDVFLVAQKDGEAAMENIGLGRPPRSFLAGFPAVAGEVSFTLTLKAGIPVAALLGNARKKAAVTLTMTSK